MSPCQPVPACQPVHVRHSGHRRRDRPVAMWEGSAGGYKGLLSSQPVWGRNGGRKDRLLPAPASRARCAPARSEVQKAVNTARGLYQRWCELLQESAVVGREELDWTTNELRNGLRSIEWDLEDLEETIDILGGGGAGKRGVAWESPLQGQGALRANIWGRLHT